MALYTSKNGKFEVISVSFSPSMIVVGEQTQMTIRLKNTSGAACRLSHGAVSINYRGATPSATGRYGRTLNSAPLFIPDAYDPFFGGPWPRNAEMTITQTLEFTDGLGGPDNPYDPDPSRHCLLPSDDQPLDYGLPVDVLGLAVELVALEYGAPDYVPDLSGGYTGALTVLARRWTPAATLSVQRGVVSGGDAAPNDEGERLMLTARLAMSPHADPSQMFCRLYYADGDEADMDDSYIDLTSSIPALLAGVTDDVSLVTRAFSNGADWYFLLAFGDPYETAVAPASIARAFANLHLSGASTGGAAFGRFSSSAEGSPKLESEYPIFAYGGIEGVTNYAPGEVDTGGRWLDGKRIYRAVAAFGAKSNNAMRVDIGASDVGQVLSLRGMAYDSADFSAWAYPLPEPTSATDYIIQLEYSRAENRVIIMTNRRTFAAGFVVMEYTKASD